MNDSRTLLRALPHLGETFTLDDAAATLRSLDPCGWPVPPDRDRVAWLLHDLVNSGHVLPEGTRFRIDPEELLGPALTDPPDHPVFAVTEWNSDIRQALSRSAVALLLVAHRLRRSLPQEHPAAGDIFTRAVVYLLASPTFREDIAAMPEPLDPARVMAAAARTIADTHPLGHPSPVDLPAGVDATSRLLGWQSPDPAIGPLQDLLAADPQASLVEEYRALLEPDPHSWIPDGTDLSAAELWTYPEFAVRTPATQTTSPVRALGRHYLYAFDSPLSETSVALDPLLRTYDPRVIGGNLLATRRDVTSLLLTRRTTVEEVPPERPTRIRAEIARTGMRLYDDLPAAEAQILAEALTLGTAVTIDYRNKAGVESRRTITNPTLVSNTLLRGFCHLRGEDRTFRIDQISRVRRAW
ncbi:hypothetical protein B842_03065 [Corynebacterium humireducens NBRC 106098 = DSM 45392]|uniref:WYL domain-containing protein n=1 Tax=Corynebacterium humireducens NBRC 106098 = DSM 45392 TaxID=1223515 RepID=A0A0B5D1H1_9CORY|nr:hypothetical protein [Corynebacterium humireducens]AJE32466.1 hypothetical protein B842_03065 [Corynebacterium humireducens NBRC 106098 = DSM 45392]